MGREAPNEWEGGFNFTHFLGPSTKIWANLSMEIHTHNKRVKIHDVIGVMRGHLEPGNFKPKN